MAGQQQRQLSKLWSHANITRHRKLEIYMSCITSKIMYSLESLWLLHTYRARIDAFHYQCLRRILRIPPSFISRVSNETVLNLSGQTSMTTLLQNRQKFLYKKIQQLSENDSLKRLVCNESGTPIDWSRNRRRGRPRQMWSHSVHNMI